MTGAARDAHGRSPVEIAEWSAGLAADAVARLQRLADADDGTPAPARLRARAALAGLRSALDPGAHTCPGCGVEHGDGRLLLADESGRTRAKIRRMRTEARRVGGEFGELLGLMADRLEIEIDTVDAFEGHLRELHARIITVLEEAIRNPTRPESAAVLNANLQGFEDILEGAGIIEARAQWSEDQRRVIETANKSTAVQALPAGVVSTDTLAIKAAIRDQSEAFWATKVVGPDAALLREGLRSALTMESLPQAVERIAERLETSRARAVTAARTEAAIFDRTVNLTVAEKAGLQTFFYGGPEDGLTRPFCRAMLEAGKVWPLDLVGQLDNRQIPGALMSAGGYNCRHRFMALSPAIAERRGIEAATDTDVRRVNAAAARRRRR
ncbi:MAG: hypothetical protein Q8Q14_00535 [Gemmatimonadales bacterium]|nr:hypothetical protein [Gemmatimonadales bacterium]